MKLESESPVALWEEKTVSVARFWLVNFYARQATKEKSEVISKPTTRYRKQ